MKWIDTVMFNGEPIIKLRLLYLYNYVDTFYITEQRYTHQGQKKEKLFIDINNEWFTPYLDKVRFLVDETDYSNETNAWIAENAQRNFSVQTIVDDHKGTQYICSVCDCDEIPNWSAVKQKTDLYDLSTNGAVIMIQKLFYYNLNWYLFDWKRAFFLNDKSIQRYMNFQLFREIDNQGPVTGSFDCGWHFSYFMEPADICRKIESFAHAEVNNPKYKTMENVRNCIINGKILYDYNYTLYRNTSMNFPNEILQFHESLVALQNMGFTYE